MKSRGSLGGTSFRIPNAMNDGSISRELYQFPATNFHQDWDHDADDWQGTVDNYFNANPTAETQRKIANEIDDMCGPRCESDLEQFLIRGVGVCYDPRPEATF